MEKRLCFFALLIFATLSQINAECLMPQEFNCCRSLDGIQFPDQASKDLYAATMANNIQKAQEAVEVGRAMVDTRGKGLGNTPLMEASKDGNLQLVEYLVAQGADVRLKNRRGLSALDYAKQSASTNKEKITKLLKHYGAPGQPKCKAC